MKMRSQNQCFPSHSKREKFAFCMKKGPKYPGVPQYALVARPQSGRYMWHTHVYNVSLKRPPFNWYLFELSPWLPILTGQCWAIYGQVQAMWGQLWSGLGAICGRVEAMWCVYVRHQGTQQWCRAALRWRRGPNRGKIIQALLRFFLK